MRSRFLIALLASACSSAARPATRPSPPGAVASTTTVPPAHATTPMANAEPPPSGPAAAIPEEVAPPSLAEVDTTITEAELPVGDTWRKRTRSASGGEVFVAVRGDENHQLTLWLIDHEDGGATTFPIGTAHFSIHDTHDGDTFAPRSYADGSGSPILFAFHAEPTTGSRSHDQVVVFTRDSSLFVARRLDGVTDWTRLLRVDHPRGATFVGIGTTYPH